MAQRAAQLATAKGMTERAQDFYVSLGMPKLPERSSASLSEGIQHTLYQGMIMPIAVLGVMAWAARRNVRKDDDDSKGGES